MRSRCLGCHSFRAIIPAVFIAFLRSGRCGSSLARLSLLVLTFGLASATVPAQSNEWTWVGGTQNTDDPGVYGTVGVASSSNLPMGRYSGVTWTDAKGNLWLFGGWEDDPSGTYSFLNDLWEYSITTGQWTWMSGSASGNAKPVYSVQGVPTPGTTPGATVSGVGWTDTNGNLWLFGGEGIPNLNNAGNELWEFNTSLGQWAWIGGGVPGNYGTLGQPDPASYPTPRSGSVGWTDLSGNFWLFGGYINPNAGNACEQTYLNDLWEYNPSTSLWAWMGGSNKATVSAGIDGCYEDGAPGIAGTLGTLSVTNIPGGRSEATGWVDSSGNFWLFGGNGFDAAGQYGTLNDLWEFTPSSGQWAWWAGVSVLTDCFAYRECAPQPGVYGTMGVPAATNSPGSRYQAAGWPDQAGNLWLLGGQGNDSGSVGAPTSWGFLNDFWVFDTTSKQWAWMRGSAVLDGCVPPDELTPVAPPGTPYDTCGLPQPGSYGTEGTSSASAEPMGRSGVAAWSDKSGNFWLFGGESFDFSLKNFDIDLNDLWEYQPSASVLPPAATPTFSPAPGLYDTTQSVTISNSMSNATIYYTTDGSVPTTSSNVYAGPIQVASTTTLNAMGTASGYPQGGIGTAVYSITPKPAVPVMTPGSGIYLTGPTVTITDSTPGMTIYYTLDGSVPTMSSSVYSGPIPISMPTVVLNAVAAGQGYQTSDIASSIYEINPSATQLPPPTFSVVPGTYTTAQSVTISDAAGPAVIYFTTDGTMPTVNSAMYNNIPIVVSATETLEAIAVAPGFANSGVGAANSNVAIADYVINPLPANFAFAASPAALSMKFAAQGSVTLTVTPQNGFASAVSFGCSGLPAGATCAFSPISVTPSGSDASTTLTISAPAAQSAALGHGSEPVLQVLAFAFVLGFFGWRRRRSLHMLLLIVFAVVGLSLVTGCGGGGSGNTGDGSGGGGSTPINATVIVTATSGSIQQTATIALTVN